MRVACLEKMRQQIILTVNPQSMKYIILALELNTCTHYISDPLSMEEQQPGPPGVDQPQPQWLPPPNMQQL